MLGIESTTGVVKFNGDVMHRNLGTKYLHSIYIIFLKARECVQSRRGQDLFPSLDRVETTD